MLVLCSIEQRKLRLWVMSVGTTILLLQTADAAPLQTGRPRTLTAPYCPAPPRPAQIQRVCFAMLVQVGAEHSIYIHTLHTLLMVKILLFIFKEAPLKRKTIIVKLDFDPIIDVSTLYLLSITHPCLPTVAVTLPPECEHLAVVPGSLFS